MELYRYSESVKCLINVYSVTSRCMHLRKNSERKINKGQV